MDYKKLADIDKRWNANRKFKPGDKVILDRTWGKPELEKYLQQTGTIIDFIHVPGSNGHHTNMFGNKYVVKFDGSDRQIDIPGMLLKKAT